MNTGEIIRDATAKREALRQYAAAHDHFAQQEQRLTLYHSTEQAEMAHECALGVLRAYRNEVDDPEPKVPDHYRTCALCAQPEYAP